MRTGLLGTLLLISGVALGKPLEVPENCFVEKKVPCLTKVQNLEDLFVVNNVTFRALNDSIIEWDSLETEPSLNLLKGAIEVKSASAVFKINQITLAQSDLLIEKKGQSLLILDLKTFMLSTFALSSIKANTVLAKSNFLEKSELLQFASHFYLTRKGFTEFAKAIQPRWKKEFKLQTATQTKVLNRSVASAREAEENQQAEALRLQQQLKKVREEFFYRTFYR